MLELIAGLLLYMAIPDAVFTALGIADAAVIMNIRDEVKREEALLDECEIYTKDYTDETPEWLWGINKDKLDFQDLVGLSVDNFQIFVKGIKKLEKKEKRTSNYTLNAFFKEGICVKIEYIRPLDKSFLYRYTNRTKGDLNFHVQNEYFPDIPVEFSCVYLDFLNFINNKDPQMFITATFCGDYLVDGVTVRCHARKPGDSDRGVYVYN